jgi:hypothetical protein
VYIHHIFFIHSSFFGYWGWFSRLATVNSAVIYIYVQVSLSYVDLHFGYLPQSGIVGSIFSFWSPYMLISIAVLLMQHLTNSIRDAFSPHPCQDLLFVFLMVAILTEVRWNPSEVSIRISFKTKYFKNIWNNVFLILIL